MKLAKSKSVQIWPLQLNDAVGLPLMAALLIRCLVKQNTNQKKRDGRATLMDMSNLFSTCFER
jgi:hypothetical protein